MESDIYMTAKRDIYQPNYKQQEEKPAQNLENLEIKKKEEEIQKEFNKMNNFGIKDSLPLMKTKEFNDLLTDFDSKKDATINDFKIINNNEENKKNDFNIIDNNNAKNEKGQNLDNNKSISSGEEEIDNNKYFSDNDKSNNESEKEEEEKCTEIDEKNENVEENIDIENIEEEKKNLKNELEKDKSKIDLLKKNISQLIGEEKYKYITEILSIGIKDDTKKEEVNDQIDKFIKENTNQDNEEKLYDILFLFISEFQYYKRKEKLNKLNSFHKD